MTIDQAIEAFVRGFAFTRSYTHPYLCEHSGGIWVMRDAERKSGDYRNEEWVSHGVSPKTVDGIARRDTRGRFMLCFIRASDEDDGPTRAEFKKLGYRLLATEALMVHHLERVAPFDGPLAVVQVTTWEMAEALNRANRRRLVLPTHLNADPPLRQYASFDGDVPVGWAASIGAGESRWCSNVFVKPEYRRRGIARALMTRMLRDDREAGAVANVLLASHAGAKLYPVLGYEKIGELMMFSPPKR